ncbi:NUDIX hydrolase [Streptomyces sp. NBC_00144]|uniref:NUDIX domain-containing protein n=1 Tax=Streptomyces sp. NBC_00144 TaxID=2975665 RepID=UPI00324D8983
MAHFDTSPLAPPPMRIGGLALIQDASGRILMVRPTYTNPEGHFQLPGGGAGDGEPDWEATVREVREETGLLVAPQRLLVKDWMPPRAGVRAAGLNFVYDCGTVPDGTPITLPAGDQPELDTYRWIPPADLDQHCADYQALRVHAALHARATGTLAELRRGIPLYEPDTRQTRI